MRLVFVLAAVLTALAAAPFAPAATYYVSPSGADGNAGTSSLAPWRTVARVNNACAAPGDTVLFQGGATFSDATLMPACSGGAATPVTFGSYGVGKAQLTAGAWLPAGLHDLVFDGLDLSSASSNVFASAASGVGVANVTLRNSIVRDTAKVGIVAQPQDSGWSILDDTIRHTGDSGIINQSPGMLIARNTIVDTGWNRAALTYATHGVYAKAVDMTIRDNDLSATNGGQALSLRMHGARVFGNAIHDTQAGIAFFNYDHGNSGTISIYANRFWNVGGYVFYASGVTDTGAASAVGAIFDSNTALVVGGGEGVNLSELTAASAEVANNVFSGAIGSGYRGCAACSEHHNVWYGVTSNRPSGTGDVFVDPQLAAAPDLTPLAGSPAIDRGTTSARVGYVAACDRQPLDYCGAAPDAGAAEYAAATAGTTAPAAPAGLTVQGTTLSWTPSAGAAGYDVYLAGARVAKTTATSYALTVACGTTATAGVDAYDAAGNVSAASSTTVTGPACAATDTTGPSLAVTSPSQQVTPLAFTAAATASDTGGVASVRFALDGATVCTDAAAPYACPISTRKGWHTLTVTAVDGVGNATSTQVSFQAKR